MKTDIAKIDPNFAVRGGAAEGELVWFDPAEAPFSLHGLIEEDGYRRMPRAVAESVSENVLELSAHTAGGRTRFVTNSPRVGIRARMRAVTYFPHMPLTGTSGFDLYRDGVFLRAFEPPVGMETGYESVQDIGDGREHAYEINFPLYNDVLSMEVGLMPGAVCRPARPYAIEKPVVFYGSSITQGGCASRPGLAYQNILSRRFDMDIVNLGFSGSARGERAMADYLAGLDMTAFVCDYDHNAPTVEHLRETHAALVGVVRAARPTLPILLVSKPDIRFACRAEDRALEDARREIIRETYEAGIRGGDKNLFFIDGERLWDGADWDGCTVDGCHPNDMGLWRMSRVIGDELAKIL